MTYSHQVRAELVCICERIHVTLFCSVPNSKGHLLMYKMQEWMNVSVSSLFPENGIGEAIFRSLKDWAGGVERRGTRVGETHGRIGSGCEPEGRGGECCGSENIEGYIGCGIKGEYADVGHCPCSAWFLFHRTSRFEVSDWTFSVRPLMAVSASCNC